MKKKKKKKLSACRGEGSAVGLKLMRCSIYMCMQLPTEFGGESKYEIGDSEEERALIQIAAEFTP